MLTFPVMALEAWIWCVMKYQTHVDDGLVCIEVLAKGFLEGLVDGIGLKVVVRYW